MPAEDLQRAHAATVDPYIGRGACYMGPVLDERTLTRHPFYPDAPPQSAGIPMMIGNTHDETRSLIGRGDPAALDVDLGRAAAAARSGVARGHLGRTRGRRVPAPVSAVFARATCFSRRPPRAVRGAPPSSKPNCAPRRVRRHSPTSSTGARPQDGGKWGAFHTLDIPLMFGTLTAPGSLTGDGADGAPRVGDDAAGAAGVRAHRRP